ncbi:MAG: hypothetical protein WCR55_13220 [Lentisphaerota bacterium]
MNNINRIYQTGTLVNAPKLALTKTNKKAVLNLTIAIELTKADTLFMDVKMWESSDEWDQAGALMSAEAGDVVFVVGKLGKDYRKKDKVIINATSIKLIAKKTGEVLRELDQEIEYEMIKKGIARIKYHCIG